MLLKKIKSLLPAIRQEMLDDKISAYVAAQKLIDIYFDEKKKTNLALSLMNYLAHLYLSFGHDDVLVGNFIADRVKGKQLYDYPLGIQKGIIMHRKIDAFTDRHDVVKRSKSRIRDRCRKFPGL